MAKNKKNGVQDLIGLERFTNYGVKTDKAEIVFFSVEPTNISVLSSANIEIKVHDLTIVLSMIPDLEIIAMDSAERFDGNKWYVKERLQKEKNPAVRELLQADHDFLDEIQLEMSSARRFMFAVRFRREKPEQIFGIISQVQKNISEHGFSVKRMAHPDTGDIYNKIGLLYMEKGDNDLAMNYYEKALLIMEGSLGMNHLDTAELYDNLSVLYYRKANYDKSFEYCEKALRIREASLGTDHLTTAISYNNLGRLYVEKGDYTTAMNYYQKALNVRLKYLDNSNIELCELYLDIAVIYSKQNKYAKSLNYYNEALRGQIKTLGKNHSDTLETQKKIDEIQKLLLEQD